MYFKEKKALPPSYERKRRLYRYLTTPHTTFIGFENNDKRDWVARIMQASDRKNIDTTLNILGSNKNKATFLASVSLTISSLIGVLMVNNTVFSSIIIYGDTRP